jgi:hypothetical protein
MASSDETTLLLKKLYHAYRHTAKLDRKGLYFSPRCMQICRPIPSFSATTREQIVQYLIDAQAGKIPGIDSSDDGAKSNVPGDEGILKTPRAGKDFYSIRPLLPSEYEFGSDENTAPIDLTNKELQRLAKEQQWVGMRVDLWDDEAALLVKVQYWWRFERIREGDELEGDTDGHGWRQCMHDIMYLGPVDGIDSRTGLEMLD